MKIAHSFSQAEPRVSKFEFPYDVSMGDRISVTCSTRSGTLPLHFEWLKNESPVAKSEKMSIVNGDEGSMLTLRQVSREDTGNYTCVVRNKEGMDAFTARLRMKSKSISPTFLVR